MKRWYNGIEININARLPRGARIFGGTSTERIITNSCSAADHDPNLLLFCDGSKNNLPWITSGKLAGSYPLPWQGHHGERRAAGAGGPGARHGADSVRRLHGRHRLRAAERAAAPSGW